jgi:hypothetical protein
MLRPLAKALPAFCFLLVLASASDAMAQYPNRFFSRLADHHPGTYGDTWARQEAELRPWHGRFYYLPFGQPTALVVPPNGTMQQNYSWGVSQNTMTPLYHQFGRSAPQSGQGGLFYATPVWPSHTDQFGVYSVRGPW